MKRYLVSVRLREWPDAEFLSNPAHFGSRFTPRRDRATAYTLSKARRVLDRVKDLWDVVESEIVPARE